MEFILLLAFFQAVESSSNEHNQCSDNLQWDPVLKLCRECVGHMIYNTTLKRCVDFVPSNENCNKGFEFDSYGKKCLDIDECNQKTVPCQKHEYCKNIPGSFKCIVKPYCGQGYEFNTTSESCKDIDECARKMDFCGTQSVCQNVPGSFNCRPHCPDNKKFYFNYACHRCDEGYRFNRSSNQCQDVDECVGPYGLQCQPFKEICVKKPGLSSCETHCSGGTLLIDGLCFDVDECEQNIHNCTDNQRCLNLFGTFMCSDIRCNVDEILDRQTKECLCKPGYKLNLCFNICQDINECDNAIPICGSHGKCQNEKGGYKCVCDQGYQYKNGTCQDIDECKLMDGVCGHLSCENAPGAFNCVCPAGFKKSSDNECEDVNECNDQPNICDSSVYSGKYQCFNLIGTHKCIESSCPSEYRSVQSSDSVKICHLINTNCSRYSNEGCIQPLPEKRVIQVIQIRNNGAMSQKIGMIEFNYLNYHHFYVKVSARESSSNKTKNQIDISNGVMLTRSPDQKRLSIHIVKPLSDNCEIVVDVQIKSNYDSEEKFDSFHQFHVFVTNGGYW